MGRIYVIYEYPNTYPEYKKPVALCDNITSADKLVKDLNQSNIYNTYVKKSFAQNKYYDSNKIIKGE